MVTQTILTKLMNVLLNVFSCYFDNKVHLKTHEMHFLYLRLYLIFSLHPSIMKYLSVLWDGVVGVVRKLVLYGSRLEFLLTLFKIEHVTHG